MGCTVARPLPLSEGREMRGNIELLIPVQSMCRMHPAVCVDDWVN